MVAYPFQLKQKWGMLYGCGQLCSVKKHGVVVKSMEDEKTNEDDERTNNKLRRFLISSELMTLVVGLLIIVFLILFSNKIVEIVCIILGND